MTKISIQGSSTGGGGGGTGTVTSVALVTGSSGTNVNVSGSPITTAGTITVNIPVASAVNTGKLSSADFIAFNAKQAALTLTTTGSSGAATLVGATLNIPQYAGNVGTVTSVALASGTTGSDVNVTGSPITGAGSITVNIPIASAVNTGKLSSANFTTFNAKQNAITLTTTGSSGAATLVGATLNVPQYASAPAGTDGQVQYNNGGAFGGGNTFVWDDVNNRLGVGIAVPTKKIHVVNDTEQCVGLFKSGIAGSRIAFMDITTLDDLEVGVGAIGNLLFLRGGANTAGTIEIGLDFADFKGNQLRNFIPRDQTIIANLTINSANQDSFCGAVLNVTGALTVTFDASIREGFNISVIQNTANSTTFATTGALTLRNRQGHTKTFGQYSTVTLYKNQAFNLILAGDTAP